MLKKENAYAELLERPGDLLDLEKRDPRLAEEIWDAFTPEQRLRVVLAARGNERERLLTMARDTRELVRALAPDEFAATVLEVGQEDAGMLVASSSEEQLTYLLDITGWMRDDLAPVRYEVWLPLIVEAGPEKLVSWCLNTDLEVMALLFAHWFRVVKFLISQDEQEPPDDLPAFTLDGVYHVEFRNQEAKDYMAQVLTTLRSEAPDRYTEIMEVMIWESAAQLADQARAWRKGRLADLGFPDRMEALELWAEPAPGERKWRDHPRKADLGFMGDAPPRSNSLVRLLPPMELLPSVVLEFDGPALDALKAELAYVANGGVVALEADPASPEEVSRAARESLGLVNLGLAVMSGGDLGEAREIVSRLGLSALARHGASAIRSLNKRAWRLMREGWLKGLPTTLHVLDPPLDRWVAGLLFPRPRCYDPGLGEGREYRSFQNRADLELAGRNLTLAEFWGELLLYLMGIPQDDIKALLKPGFLPEDPVDIKTSHILGTWLACRDLGIPGLRPIPAERLGEALSALQKGLAGQYQRDLAVSLEALSDPGLAALAGEAVRAALGRLSDQVSHLDLSKAPDSRFVDALVIEP